MCARKGKDSRMEGTVRLVLALFLSITTSSVVWGEPHPSGGLASNARVGEAWDPRNFSDPTLPGFHLVAYPFEWINDPNGPLFDPVHNMYHLFYQYKTPREWGHAASKDLVDWVQLPVALSRQASYDSDGDFSGSATVLDDDARSIVLIASTPNGALFFATPTNRSDPYLVDWEYASSEPFYLSPVDARDPTELWQDDQGRWQLGFGTENGTALLQTQPNSASPLDDGNHWESAGFIQRNGRHGGFWECPDLFSLTVEEDDKSKTEVWVSKFSKITAMGDWYFLGQYVTEAAKFLSQSLLPRGMIDRNPNFYASKTFYDPKQDRRVLWGWIKMNEWPPDPTDDGASAEDDNAPADGQWQNALSVPRAMSIIKANTQTRPRELRLTNYPIPELELLRGSEALHLTSLELASGASTVLETSGRMLDIEADVVASAPGIQCGFQVLLSEDGQSFVETLTLPSTTADQEFALRVLVDASIVETFQNGGETTHTQFLNLSMTGSGVGSGIAAVARETNKAITPVTGGSSVDGASCTFKRISAWPMRPFSFDASMVQ